MYVCTHRMCNVSVCVCDALSMLLKIAMRYDDFRKSLKPTYFVLYLM